MRDVVIWLKNMELEEKIFLGIFSSVLSLLIIFIFSKTTLFYYPEYQGEKVDFDALFTSDSGNLYDTNVFVNMGAFENDIRQPLFDLPLGIASYILSAILGFVKDSYVLILQILQVIILGVSVILLGRLLNLKAVKNKVYFYLLLSLSYSFLVWSLVLEQYIVAYFFLIVFIGNFNHEKYKRLLYVGALGTLTTSGILFPLLFKKLDGKSIFHGILEIAFYVIAFMIFVGKFHMIVGGIDYLMRLSRFLGKDLTFIDRFYQFLNFVSLCFIAPKIMVNSGGTYSACQS